MLHIASGIREFAAATPSAVAVRDGERSLTYAALDDRANRLGRALLASGLTPGERVAVVLGNRLEYPEIAAGLARAGLPMVPINPRLTAAEVTHIVAHAGARALVLDDAYGEVVSAAVDHERLATVLSIDGDTLGPAYEGAVGGEPGAPLLVEALETDPFCIAYTSGTTGRAKGVVISHRSRVLTFLASALEWRWGPGRRTVAVAPLYHGAGFAFGYGPLHVGATVTMLASFDPERLLELVARQGIESLFLVPTHAQMMRSLDEHCLERAGLDRLDTLFFNAAALPDDLKTWVLDSLPQVGLHEVYGSTEAGVISDLRPPDQRRKVRCVGPPWYMTEIRVRAADGTIVGPGGTGECFSRSPYLMNGYLDDPEATSECTDTDGFLTSGDVVRLDDEGFLHIVDRVKDVVISGGTNVYPREVEDVVRNHADVADVAVVGRPDDTWGEVVTAVVVLRQGAALDPESLAGHCRGQLAGYKVPKVWESVAALPRNAAGKVLKRELRDPAPTY